MNILVAGCVLENLLKDLHIGREHGLIVFQLYCFSVWWDVLTTTMAHDTTTKLEKGENNKNACFTQPHFKNALLLIKLGNMRFWSNIYIYI